MSKADKGNAWLRSKVTRHTGGAPGDIGKILFIRPFVHKRIQDQSDPPFMQECRYPGPAMIGIGIKNMVDQFKHMRRFACGASHKVITMPMRKHQGREHMSITGGKTGNPGRASAVKHDPTILDLLARDVQSIDKARSINHGAAMLIIVKDRNIHHFFKLLLDNETFGRFDIFKGDAAKRLPYQCHPE